MRYYIADCHFFHKKLNDNMDCRGFASVEEMNVYMLKKWNAKVRSEDEVVILGDLSLGKAEETKELLNRLHGQLYLIIGKLCDLSSGNAILKNTLIAYPGKGVPCDIKYRGKLYKDFGAFISDFYNDIDEDVSDEYALLPKSFN